MSANVSAGAEVAEKVGAVRGRFTRVGRAAVTPHGFMTHAVSEKIYRIAVGETGYDLGDTTEEEREEFLGCLTEALATATSTEVEYDEVHFVHDGMTYTLSTLDNICAVNYPGPNPLRTWVRSFRKGEMCARISDYLATPDNIEARQTAAARYGMDVSNAYLCFDTADGLLRTGRSYSHSEIMMINSARAFATENSRIKSQVNGIAKPMQDANKNIGGKELGVAASTTPEARASFKTVR